MAIAGFQNICGINSFHGESQPIPSGPWIGHDIPGFKTSTVFKIWREMEREHGVSHSQWMRDRIRRNLDESKVSNADAVSTVSVDRQDSEDSLSDYSVIVQDCGVCEGQMSILCDQDDRNSCTSELTDDIDEVDRVRVRQIFQDWHMKNGTVKGSVSQFSNVNCENECERVRTVRKWIKMNGQHIGIGSRDKQISQNDIQINHLQDGFVSNGCVVGGKRRIRKIYGRQTLVEVLKMAENERQRELKELSQRQPVSGFVHRNRIQSLLRGRFLQSGRLVQDKEPSSSADSELGLLRKKLPVSGLRFLSMLDNLDVGSQSHASSICTNSNNNTFGDGQLDITDKISELPASADIVTMEEAIVELHVQLIIEDSDVRKDEDTGNVIANSSHQRFLNKIGESLHEQGESSSSNMVGYDSTTPGTNNEDEGWFHNEILTAQVIQELPEEELWNDDDDDDFDISSEISSSSAASEEEEDGIEIEGQSYQSTNFPNVDNTMHNNAELQELSIRRRVSNLLSSEFRHTLDQIVQSYVERQQTDETSSSFLESSVEDEYRHDHHPTRFNTIGMELDEINELKMEMGRLQKQLNEMQRMLETFMAMQMEFQLSIHQEMVSALNHSFQRGPPS